MIGKTRSAIIELGKLFQNAEIKKTYFAITIGAMNTVGYINFLIDKKIAQTKFEVLKTVVSERFGCLNFVKLAPKTGRKHQLRKHVSEIGNPILGDKKYFLTHKILTGKGLFLHAGILDFVHPFTNDKISITKKLPKKFTKIFPDF